MRSSDQIAHVERCRRGAGLAGTDVRGARAAFFEPKHEFTVVMEYGSEERSLTIELDEAKSLQDLFAGGYTATDASVDEWRALVPDAGYQNNCNRQGFNTESDGCHVGMSHCRLRPRPLPEPCSAATASTATAGATL